MLYTTLDSPIGTLLLTGDGDSLRGLHLQEGPRPETIRDSWERAEAPFEEARRQLAEYFAGERADFDLPLTVSGTPFQRRVWRALAEIPYGRTIGYGELARRIGSPTASRAVGTANGSNPIAIVVPCHRVIGTNGTLTGYGGGLERKRFLLELEATASSTACSSLTRPRPSPPATDPAEAACRSATGPGSRGRSMTPSFEVG